MQGVYMKNILFYVLLTCFVYITGMMEATIDETLRLAKGHQEFRDLYFKVNEPEFVRLIKDGQSPKFLFIGCSDSRVVPDLILNTKPGDLFVIRTAGNFVPPYAAAASWGDGVAATIQFAIEYLNVPHIIVCGHSHCGAIQGLFQPLDQNKFGILKKWLRFGEEAKRITLMTAKMNTPMDEIYDVAEHINVIYQLEHLMTFPFIKQRVDNGTLILHGWFYRIETGELSAYDPQTYQFRTLNSLIDKRQQSASEEKEPALIQ